MSTRFAPSPTGLLHLGHAYAAIFARNLAEANKTKFLLRFEDIDTTRVREPYYLAIEQDLTWLGIAWDGIPLRQTDRLPAYAQILENLKSQKVVYPCFCTRREILNEIANIGGAPHINNDSGETPYPGTCRALSSLQRRDRIQSGEAHCWRLDSRTAAEQTGPLSFEDEIHGHVQVDPEILGDVVLARKDIPTSYHIAVVADDAMQQITDVTRGEDLLTSTHIHRTLQHLLGYPQPRYHHHRLILDDQHKRLAKRDNALSIQTLREQGKSPEEVLAMLA